MALAVCFLFASFQAILPPVVTNPQECPTSKNGFFALLRDTLPLTTPETDEFGLPSEYVSLVGLVRHLMSEKNVTMQTAVNLSARDGIGSMGNTDPTWPLYKVCFHTSLVGHFMKLTSKRREQELHFGGMAVEASTAF